LAIKYYRGKIHEAR